jgi:hypothetical protein
MQLSHYLGLSVGVTARHRWQAVLQMRFLSGHAFRQAVDVDTDTN